MSDFTDVKVGDEVFTTVFVSYGWNREQRFWIKASVEAVTKKQFTVMGTRFWKETGNAVSRGDYRNCVKEGEKQYWRSETPIKDQSAEMSDFKEVVRLSRMANIIISELKVEIGDMDIEKIKTILVHLTKVRSILTENE